jgi:hypothetical protein
VCTEANSVKGAEAADFFFYCWYLKVLTDHAIWTYGLQAVWKYISTVLDIDTRCRSVVSLNPRSLYPPRTPPPPRNLLYRGLSGPQSLSGWRREEKNIPSLTRIEPRKSNPLCPLMFWGCRCRYEKRQPHYVFLDLELVHHFIDRNL